MGLLIPHSLAEKPYFSETAKPFTRHLIRVIDIVCCGFLSLHSQKLAVNSWMVCVAEHAEMVLELWQFKVLHKYFLL